MTKADAAAAVTRSKSPQAVATQRAKWAKTIKKKFLQIDNLLEKVIEHDYTMKKPHLQQWRAWSELYNHQLQLMAQAQQLLGRR